MSDAVEQVFVFIMEVLRKVNAGEVLTSEEQAIADAIAARRIELERQ